MMDAPVERQKKLEAATHLTPSSLLHGSLPRQNHEP